MTPPDVLTPHIRGSKTPQLRVLSLPRSQQLLISLSFHHLVMTSPVSRLPLSSPCPTPVGFPHSSQSEGPFGTPVGTWPLPQVPSILRLSPHSSSSSQIRLFLFLKHTQRASIPAPARRNPQKSARLPLPPPRSVRSSLSTQLREWSCLTLCLPWSAFFHLTYHHDLCQVSSLFIYCLYRLPK